MYLTWRCVGALQNYILLNSVKKGALFKAFFGCAKNQSSRAVSRPQNNINNHGQQMEVMMDACCELVTSGIMRLH